MDQQDMINAITTALQTESNLIALLQAQVAGSLQFMSTDQLQVMCTILGIDTSGGGQ